MSEAPPPLPGSPGRSDAPPPLPPRAPSTQPSEAVAAAPAATPDLDHPLNVTCPACGATTAYAPGTTVLKCPSCGAESAIEGPVVEIEEHSYDEWASAPRAPVASIGQQVLRCQNCGATTETDDLSGACQFCSGALVAVSQPEGLIPPEAVVPFHIDRSGASQAFGTWVRSRWFAPNSLKKVGSTERLAGTYVPHWTYDSHTETDYTGQRGEYYYVTVQVQVSDGKGGTRTESRQERRTRWYPASGHVARSFDDVVVVGSNQLPGDKLEKMGPWELERATSYRPEYLAGYSALRYDVDPDAGMQSAREQMKSVIEGDCRSDIGGDEQRVSSMQIGYSANMFKLVLLPLWIASYLHGGKTFQVMVNANTGEVVGDRPFSPLKIAALVVAILVVIGVIAAIYASSQ